MMVLGDDSVLPGRAFQYTLPSYGKCGAVNSLTLIEKAVTGAMMPDRARAVTDIPCGWLSNIGFNG